MRQHRIYLPGDLDTNREIVLDKESYHYLSHVLRLKDQTAIQAFNGNGNEYNGIFQLNKKSASIVINEISHTEQITPLCLHLLQGVARGEHMDIALQKSTELGVSMITPVITERTQQHNQQRLTKRFTHWQKVITSACEQSGRCTVPCLQALSTFSESLQNIDANIKVLFDPDSRATLADLPADIDSIVLIIGPEGGLSKPEISEARNNGFIPLSLGPRILRTETAALSALAILQYKYGDI